MLGKNRAPENNGGPTPVEHQVAEILARVSYGYGQEEAEASDRKRHPARYLVGVIAAGLALGAVVVGVDKVRAADEPPTDQTSASQHEEDPTPTLQQEQTTPNDVTMQETTPSDGEELTSGSLLAGSEKAPSGDTNETDAKPKKTFRVASFNFEGASHTDGPNADHRGRPHSAPRLHRAVKIINDNKLDVIGAQEFQPSQRKLLLEIAGDKFATFPAEADYANGGPSVNSIIYRKSRFEVVQGGSRKFIYFDSTPDKYPWVKLRDRETGEVILFLNTHDPANVHGGNARKRLRDVKIHLDDVRELSENGEIPTVFTGDFNSVANSKPDCRYYASGVVENVFDKLHAGDRVYRKHGDNAKCPPDINKRRIFIDWILANKLIGASSHILLQNKDTEFSTDHDRITISDVYVK